MANAQPKPLPGFLLALLATMTWGSLPVAAQQALKAVDAPTLVWARFLSASLVLLAVLAAIGRLPRAGSFSKHTFALLALGVLGILGNFVLVAVGLRHISPTTTQILWQLAPFTMILVGVLLFKEAFTRWQKIGLLYLLAGLALFFNDEFGELFSLGSYAFGVAVAAVGSVVWVCYGVAQKLLSAHFTSQQVLLLIYFCSSMALLPFAFCRACPNRPHRQPVFVVLLHLLLPEHAHRLRRLRRIAEILGRVQSQHRYHAHPRVYHGIFRHRPPALARRFRRFRHERGRLCRRAGGCLRRGAGRGGGKAVWEGCLGRLFGKAVWEGCLGRLFGKAA